MSAQTAPAPKAVNVTARLPQGRPPAPGGMGMMGGGGVCAEMMGGGMMGGGMMGSMPMGRWR